MQHQPLHQLRLCLAAFLLVVCAHGMSVRAPSFPELVSRSESVVEATVIGKRCAWEGSGTDRHIETYVHIRVDKVIAGSAPSEMDLQILGGTVDGQSMEVVGMTKFEVGDRDVLFLHGNGKFITPLVAMNYGRYLIISDAAHGKDYVVRSDGTPLRSVQEIPLPLSERVAKHTLSAESIAAGTGGTMTLSAFEQAIKGATVSTPTPATR